MTEPTLFQELPDAFIDRWLSTEDFSEWREIDPGHLVGPDARPQDDFDRLPDFDTWLARVRADLKIRCRLPR